MDEQDNVDTGETDQDNTPDEQVADAEESANSPEEGQPAEETEKVYAGKFKSDEELEKAYKSLESKLGNYKEVEEKARAFDQLSRAQEQTPIVAPDITQFTDYEGNIDFARFNQANNQYMAQVVQRSNQTAGTVAQERIDTEKSERDFPYLAEDRDAAEAVASMYQSGRAKSIYDAAKKVDNIRKGVVESASKDGATRKQKEIAAKMKSSTEKASGKAGDGISQEAFNSMSLDDKKAFLDRIG